MQGATTTITEADTSSLTYCYAIGFGAHLLAKCRLNLHAALSP